MHSSNGLTITCRPKRGWLSAQDFEALKKDGYGYNSTEFCKAGGCSSDGYTYEPSCRRWSNPMAVTDFQELQSLAPKTTKWIKHAVERKAPIQDCCSVGMDEHSS